MTSTSVLWYGATHWTMTYGNLSCNKTFLAKTHANPKGDLRQSKRRRRCLVCEGSCTTKAPPGGFLDETVQPHPKSCRVIQILAVRFGRNLEAQKLGCTAVTSKSAKTAVSTCLPKNGSTWNCETLQIAGQSSILTASAVFYVFFGISLASLPFSV